MQSVPAYSSAAVPGAACLDDAVAALTAAASQAIPDCLAAPAQHALLVGLLRRELKPYGDRSFRQYTATYKEALEVMAQVGWCLIVLYCAAPSRTPVCPAQTELACTGALCDGYMGDVKRDRASACG